MSHRTCKHNIDPIEYLVSFMFAYEQETLSNNDRCIVKVNVLFKIRDVGVPLYTNTKHPFLQYIVPVKLINNSLGKFYFLSFFNIYYFKLI